MTKIPELQLSDVEARELSKAIGKVSDFYDSGASEKTLAWVNLAVCAGGIYGTRVFAYSIRTKTEADAKRQLAAPQQQRPNLHPFPNQAPVAGAL